MNTKQIDKEIFKQQLSDFLIYEKPRREQLCNYYHGKQDINKGRVASGRPNNILHTNFAKYITDVQTGYFMGIPTTFEFVSQAAQNKLMSAFKRLGMDELMFNLARDISIYGTGYALVYYGTGGICTSQLDPQRAFVIRDTDIAKTILGGVRIYSYKDGRALGELYSAGLVRKFTYDGHDVTFGVSEPLGIDVLSVVEFCGNSDNIGDFEPVLSLIDAYNVLLSGAIDDMQSVANAFLALYGMQGTTKEDIERANLSRVLSLSENGKAEFIVKNVNPEAIELLKQTLLDNMLMVTMTPNLNDERFASTVSGVAMEYKLWGIEQSRAEKQRNFSRGLYELIALIGAHLSFGGSYVDSDCTLRFYKNLPQDLAKVCANVVALDGIISHRTKLEMLPFIDDVPKELARVKTEKGTMKNEPTEI